MKLLSMHCVSDRAPHSAFTDLALFRERLWCAFREGESHALCPGKIRVMSSKDGLQWKDEEVFSLEGQDLRDPHFALRPDGTLELIMGRAGLKDGRYSDRGNLETILDTTGWRPLSPICQSGDWLWRADWDDSGRAWGISYRLPGPRHWTVHLMTRRSGEAWREQGELPIKGLPNEATVRSFPDGRLYILLRRETDRLGTTKARALVGIGSSLPSRAKERRGGIDEDKDSVIRWKWHRLPWRIGGPNLIPLSGPRRGAVAGFRLLTRDTSGSLTGRTVIASCPPATKSTEPLPLEKLRLELELPSSGDCSYPGLVEQDGQLLVSWYSSHSGRAAVYFGRVALD